MKIIWILYYTAAVHEYYCRVSHPANNIRGEKAGSPTKYNLLYIYSKKCFSITMNDTQALIWEPVSF